METNYKLLDESEKLKSKDNQIEEEDKENINYVQDSCYDNINNFSLNPFNIIFDSFGPDSIITKIIFTIFLIHPFLKLFSYRNTRVASLFTKRQLKKNKKIVMGIMLFCLLITIFGLKNISSNIVNLLQIIILFYILLHIYLFSNSAFFQNLKDNGFKFVKKK